MFYPVKEKFTMMENTLPGYKNFTSSIKVKTLTQGPEGFSKLAVIVSCSENY
jgi:hypothetical protein